MALNNNQSISSTHICVRAYPSPFTNSIVINITGDAGKYQLMLIDAAGQIVWTKSGNKNAGAFLQSVNTSTLERGIYILRVIQNNNTSMIKLKK
jgi:hypothetical protein